MSEGGKRQGKAVEDVGRFDHLSISLLQLGIDCDGRQDPPNLLETDFESHEHFQLARMYLEEMLSLFPETIAERQKADHHEPLLPSIFFSSPYREAPEIPPMAKPKGREV